VKTEAAEGAENGGDMAVRERAENLEGTVDGDKGLAFEEAAEGVDLSGGPGGEIGECAFVDFGAIADGLAEEDGGRGVAVRDGLNIHGT
jgi:hypothetical protein